MPAALSSVARFPNNGIAPSNADIARHLHEQADMLEDPASVDIRTCIMIFETTDGGFWRTTFGTPIDHMRAAGVLMKNVEMALNGSQSTID